jgi:hypothetical protein
MKQITNIRCLAMALSLAIATILPIHLRADSYAFDNLYYSGSGTWENGPAGTQWADFGHGFNYNWDNTLQNDAEFFNPGTVNVVGNVSANYLYFAGSSDTYVLQGGEIDKNANNSQGGLILQNDGASNDVIINNNVVVDTAGNTDRFNIVNYGANSTIDFEGTIGFTDSAPSLTSYRSLIFNAIAPGQTFILNGVDTSGTTKSINIRFNEGNQSNATLLLKGDYSTINGGDFIDLASGTVVLDTSLTPAGKNIVAYNGNQVTDTHAVLTQGSQNISNLIYGTIRNGVTQGTITVGQNTAGSSNFSGGIGLDGTDVVLTSVAGGRANISNNIFGDSPDGLVKTGADTVILSNPSGNSYTLNGYYYTGHVAADLQAGTTLITNTSGSAFGNAASPVNVELGAKLGGSGISTQAVVVAGGGIIAPGDSGADGGTAGIATLHLTGGLSMANGAVMAFKLNGAANDAIALGSGALTLAGTTNVVFSSMGTVNVFTPGNPNWYTLATGGTGLSAGTWTTSPTFNFTAPAGYNVDHVNYNAASNTFQVDFAAVPEPSTYALMIGGLAFLAFCVRRKNRMV